MFIYKLVKEDLSSLGHMGSSSTIVGTDYFDSLNKAKAHAVKDNKASISWEKSGVKRWDSGDLRSHMYVIHRIQVR